MLSIHKYPRTHRIEGSRLQPGDEDLDAVPFDTIAGRQLVVEEKMDGANCGISFNPSGELLLQSRGHYLTGGGRDWLGLPPASTENCVQCHDSENSVNFDLDVYWPLVSHPKEAE